MAVILGALSNKKMEVGKLLFGRIRQTVDYLDEELVEFLTRNRAYFEMVETFY